LNLKEGGPGDSEAQTIEDALCLVFLEYQLGDLAAKLPPDKLVNALRKSWNKMSDNGRRAALALPLSSAQKSLLSQVLASDQGNS
jgi:hypothetical protein